MEIPFPLTSSRPQRSEPRALFAEREWKPRLRLIVLNSNAHGSLYDSGIRDLGIDSHEVHLPGIRTNGNTTLFTFVSMATITKSFMDYP